MYVLLLLFHLDLPLSLAFLCIPLFGLGRLHLSLELLILDLLMLSEALLQLLVVLAHADFLLTLHGLLSENLLAFELDTFEFAIDLLLFITEYKELETFSLG